MGPIVLIFAMEIEALPFLQEGDFRLIESAQPALPLRFYESKFYPKVKVVLNGRCKIHHVDRIGTRAATLSAWESIRQFSPSLLLSTGTAGGYSDRGAQIGDIYLSHKKFLYHDRRIPIPEFSGYESGGFPINFDNVEDLAKQLGVKCGIVSSGDSVTLNNDDDRIMRNNGVTVKEMEACAIAEIAHMTNTPMLALKCITDLVDHPETVMEQFFQNYKLSISKLTVILKKFLEIYLGSTPRTGK